MALNALRQGSISLEHFDQLAEIIAKACSEEGFVSITSLSRDDFLNLKGINTQRVKEMPDSTLARIASKMADDYLEQMYWESLRINAEHVAPELFDREYEETYQQVENGGVISSDDLARVNDMLEAMSKVVLDHIADQFTEEDMDDWDLNELTDDEKLALKFAKIVDRTD